MVCFHQTSKLNNLDDDFSPNSLILKLKTFIVISKFEQTIALTVFENVKFNIVLIIDDYFEISRKGKVVTKR